jgi:RNA polymerase sigma-70 factor (ECF subfamily)
MHALEFMVTEPRPLSAASHETEAFDARFALARDRLVRICAGFVGADAAEDVAQDTYLRARERRNQLHDLDLFEAWLTRIAINLCVNRHRSGRRLLEMLPSFLSQPTAAERDLGLRELVEQLPARERTLVVLHYGHGYRLDEIARMSGLSAINVRTIVFRARRRLASRLREADR